VQDLVGPTLGGRYRLLGSAFGVQMHQAQRLTDLRVSERAKPARAPTQQRRLNATAHGLDKEDFGQSVDDRGRPRQVLRGFGGNELQVDWNHGVALGPDAGSLRIGGRCFTSRLLSGDANVKHPATTDVGVPPPPYRMSRDR